MVLASDLTRPIDRTHSYYTSPCVSEIGLHLTAIEEICNIFYTLSIQHCMSLRTEMKFGLAWVNHCQPNIRSFLNKKKNSSTSPISKESKKKISIIRDSPWNKWHPCRYQNPKNHRKLNQSTETQKLFIRRQMKYTTDL